MAAVWFAGGFWSIAGAAPPVVRVLIFSGQNNHDWKTTTPKLQAILTNSGRFSVEVTEHPEHCTAATFAKYDLILSDWNAWGNAPVKEWPAATRAAFLAFIRSGKGYVSIHAGSSSFYDWPEYQQIGGLYWDLKATSHGAPHEFTVQFSGDHPITRGQAPFQTKDELWVKPGVHPAARVLATGDGQPLAVTTTLGKGRGFALLLGHSAEFMATPGAQTLLLRGGEWAATGKVTLRDAAAARPAQSSRWRLGTPIVTYWAGPPMTDAVAQQMVEGGFNLVWCANEKELDVAHRHGLRALLTDGLLSPASLDDPARREKLEALLARVRHHPALYACHLVDEPNAAQFPALGRLVAYLRERDPAHLAYINLFPTYASNEQLGTKGDVVTAYQEHLRLYVAQVKPALISYDHYQFALKGDTDQYFLNLAMIRRAAQDAGVPFLNIVQACTWATNAMRIPNTNELRYLVYTTLAYGAQGISYYVYAHPGHYGSIASFDGTPGPLYHALKGYNREFLAIARQLQPLRSFAVHHTAMRERGCEPLPEGAAFRLDAAKSSSRPRGFLVGTFGGSDYPSHVVVVNLDYTTPAKAALIGPRALEVFDATTGRWSPTGAKAAELNLPPGGGQLVRVAR